MKEFRFENLGISVRENGEHDFGNGWTVGKVPKVLKYKMLFSSVTQKSYYLHRLMAIAFVRNPAPTELKHVDHIDRDKMNNAASNLRWVTPALNNLNRITKNYDYNKRFKNFRVRTKYDGSYITLGWFATKEEAQTMTNTWKQLRFRVEFLAYVTNDKQFWHSEDRRGYLFAEEAGFAAALKFAGARVSRHRSLRKALRMLLANHPTTTVAIRF